MRSQSLLLLLDEESLGEELEVEDVRAAADSAATGAGSCEPLAPLEDDCSSPRPRPRPRLAPGAAAALRLRVFRPDSGWSGAAARSS